MGLLRSKSQTGLQEKKTGSVLRKDSAVGERSVDIPPTRTLRQKSVSSQDRPKTAHSQPDRPKTAHSQQDRPKTADKHQDKPKTADKQQTVDRRRSFSRPRTATSASSAPKIKDREKDKEFGEMAMPAQTIEFKAGKDTYNFPTPSPRLPLPRSATQQASPASSPLVAAVVDDSPKIGMAIGSPREMPPRWGRTNTVDQVAKKLPARPPPARAMTEVPQAMELAPEKTSKKKASWKTFGGIFGRKPSTKAAAPEPFYKLQPPREQDESAAAGPSRKLHSATRYDTPSPALSPGGDRSPMPGVSGHRRTPSMTRGIARLEARAQADRAAFMEKEEREKDEGRTQRGARTPSMIQREGFSPTFGSAGAPRTSEEIFKTMEASSKRNDSPLSVTDGLTPLRLDLDIPDHHMERYSVMFEKFLSNDDKRPSILERRQSKLQKKRSLKRLDEVNSKTHIETPAVLQRSATSPHLGKMPSLSIKTGKKVQSPKASPLEPAQPPVTAVHRPPPPKRSNTAPSSAISPVRQNFSKPRMVVVTEPDTAAGSSDEPAPHLRGLSMYSENSLPPTPTSAETSLEPTLHPPAQGTKHAADSSGTWDMLSANPNTAAVPKRRVSLQRKEPENPYRRVKSPEDLESRVVQVSVARQVSVSKARKQVRQAVDSKQPLRPRVVELSKNRKSTVVLIEGGEE